MKLATYRDGSRDGQLIVVSRDLLSAHHASHIAGRLQTVLDDWDFLSPQLQDLSLTLNQGKARHAFAFEPQRCMAPLPRPPAWAELLACPGHLPRLARALKRELPPLPAGEPLLMATNPGALAGACDEAALVEEGGDAAWDCHATLVAALAELPRSASPARGLDAVRLLMLGSAWTSRVRMAAELRQGWGLFHSRPLTALSPVAVTPDELGEAWQGGRMALPVRSHWRGKETRPCDAAAGMHWHLGQLAATLARSRRLPSGSLLSSGPISPASEERGCAGLAEWRALELAGPAGDGVGGRARTAYLKAGDTVRLEVIGRDGQSVFGAIEQSLVEAE